MPVQPAGSILDVPIRHVGIVDADVLIDDLIAYVQSNGTHTLFGRLGGPIRWIASSHVYDEMYRPDALGHKNKFEKIAGQSRGKPWETAAAHLRRVFEDRYLETIRFVDVTDVMVDHELAVAVAKTDVHDELTGRLAALMEVAGFLVFSRDKALKRPGLAPADIAPVAASIKVVAQTDALMPGLEVVGRVTFGAFDVLADARSVQRSPNRPWHLARTEPQG